MQIKLLSWNIWQGNHFSEIADFLKTQNPHVIGLQEVVERDGTNTAVKLADILGYQCTYYRAIDKNGFGVPQGNAILSSFPIIESKCHFLSDSNLYKETAETEPRIAVEANIQVKDETLTVFSVHLAYSHMFKESTMRDLQVDNLIKLLPMSKTILLGDFNSHPDSLYMKKLNQVLSNTDDDLTSPTWTIYPFDYQGFKEIELRHRLDYIFTSKDIKVESFKVETSKGSDHLPISAVIEV